MKIKTLEEANRDSFKYRVIVRANHTRKTATQTIVINENARPHDVLDSLLNKGKTINTRSAKQKTKGGGKLKKSK